MGTIPTIRVVECFEYGGFVQCTAPTICHTDCKKYKAKLLLPTEAWGRDEWSALSQKEQAARLTTMETLGLIRSRS